MNNIEIITDNNVQMNIDMNIHMNIDINICLRVGCTRTNFRSGEPQRSVRNQCVVQGPEPVQTRLFWVDQATGRASIDRSSGKKQQAIHTQTHINTSTYTK